MNASTPQLPANYRMILDVVNEYGAGRHATAQDVFMRARELRPGIGFTTVHRGLARLHELGYVLKLDITGEGSALYEPAAEAHAHFRCTACGSVADVDYASDARPVLHRGAPWPRDPQRVDHVYRSLPDLLESRERYPAPRLSAIAKPANTIPSVFCPMTISIIANTRNAIETR